MKKLIKELGVNTMTLPLDKKGRHQKHYYDGEKRKTPLGSDTTDKYFNLVKKVFNVSPFDDIEENSKEPV